MDQTQRSTRERIIEFAGDIFGQKGFKETTIRAIAEAADVNVAAINYHFRDKEGLYTEVIEDIFSKGFQRFPSLVPNSGPHLTPEEKLKVFIKGTLYRLLSPEGWGGQRGKGRLIAREMLDFTPPFAQVMQKYIRPHKDELIVILRALMGEDTNQENILFSVVSILGQCIYYVYATSLIELLAPEYAPLEKNIDRIVEHVFRFSLGGLTNIKQDNKEEA